jgi:hypothetical protein
MSVTATKTYDKPHTTELAVPHAPPPAAAEAAPAPYWGDRLALVFWLWCAGILVALHVGMHVACLWR